MFLAPSPTARRLAALALAALLGAAGCGGATSSGHLVDGVQRWDAGHRPTAPHLSGTTLAGTSYDASAAAQGKVLVVNFWASWCPPCQDEAQGLAQVSKDLAGQGVQFLGVDVRDQKSQAQLFSKRYGVDYPSLFDPSSKTVLAFHEPALPTEPPTTIVIDRHGKVAAMIVGEATYTTLKPLVAQIAQEQA